MTELAAHGVSVTLPSGWEGRVFRRPAAGEDPSVAKDDASPSVSAQSMDSPPAPAGETTNAVVHVSTIALPPDVGDFASGAVDQLGATDALIVLFEYDREAASQPLFANAGMPRVLDTTEFSPGVLQRSLAGQAGYQRFFHEAGRAFCLYVVLGAYDRRGQVVPEVNRVLATLAIDGGSAPTVTGTVLDVVRARAGWSTFAALLDESGVASQLQRTSAVTVFAPVDAQVPESQVTALRADPDRLRRTMLQHVVEERLALDVLTTRTTLTTAAGGTLTVTTTGGLQVGGLAASAPIEAVDGYVYPTAGLFEAPK